MKSLGLEPLFDKITIINEPANRNHIVEIIKNMANDLGCEKAIMIGDSPSKDMVAANEAGIPGIWANFYSHNTVADIECINNKAATWAANIYAFVQLPSVLESLEEK